MSGMSLWGNWSEDAAPPSPTGGPAEGEAPLLSEHWVTCPVPAPALGHFSPRPAEPLRATLVPEKFPLCHRQELGPASLTLTLLWVLSKTLGNSMNHECGQRFTSYFATKPQSCPQPLRKAFSKVLPSRTHSSSQTRVKNSLSLRCGTMAAAVLDT